MFEPLPTSWPHEQAHCAVGKAVRTQADRRFSGPSVVLVASTIASSLHAADAG